MADIEIALDNKEFFVITKEKLREFPYFKVLMEDNPTVNRFVIPNNLYMDEIYNLLRDNIDLNNLNIEDTLKYIRASASLGHIDKNFVFHLEKSVNKYEDIINLSEHVSEISEMRLMSLVSNLCAKVILKYIELSSEQKVPGDFLSTKMVAWIIRIIPYITEFKVALIICNFYGINHNLITANPTINDIYRYESSRLDQICQIYEYNKNILDTFLSYFDNVDYETSNFLNSEIIGVSKNNVDGTKDSFVILGSTSPAELPNPFIDYGQAKLRLKSLSR